MNYDDLSFYIDSCSGSNNAGDIVTNLVVSGCANKDDSEPLASISPKLNTDGNTVTFEQFAYVAPGEILA